MTLMSERFPLSHRITLIELYQASWYSIHSVFTQFAFDRILDLNWMYIQFTHCHIETH